MDQQILPRQLVICCDGTNNNLTGGIDDTNVVKVAQLFAQSSVDPSQMLFYDPGVGNPGELPGATPLDTWVRRAERIAGLAFGRGVYENMAECYLFLMRHYRPGDEIYIFGFSRGAFTARSLAGLINQFGVLLPHMESMIPTLIHIYFSDRDLASGQIAAIAKQTTELFAGPESRQIDIAFVGVWDTVASVGMWPFDAKITAKPTIQGKRFLNVRQAVALDEHRAQFKPRLYVDNNGTYETASGRPATIKQVWFRGSHCDVGGGYTQGETSISDKAMGWLLSEAVQCGLRLSHAGILLDTESAVATAIGAQRDPHAMPRVHSELHATNLWALTGMVVRDTQRVTLDNGVDYDVKSVEHDSVKAAIPSFPANTVWTNARPKTLLWVNVIATLLLPIVLGQLLLNHVYADNWFEDLKQLPRDVGPYLQKNLDFARWQLLWWLDGGLKVGLKQFAFPQWAIFWDFALIGAYSYVLSWFAVPAFARLAGLQRVGDPIPRFLNRLGWALPMAFFGDVFENLASWTVIACLTIDWTVLGGMSALLMTLCSCAKWVGIFGTFILILVPGKSRPQVQN